MMKLAVIGKDVSQSQSPQMHRFIFNALGETCSYDAVSIPPERFGEKIGDVLAAYDAINVTIPFKEEMIPYLRELRGDAPVFGAVNTVLCRESVGYNTDGFGFLLMLANAGVSVGGKKVLVLGAGGAGRSCIKKLLDAGAETYAYERDRERLAAVHAEFPAFTPLERVPFAPFDVVVNCTGIGMHKTVGRTPSVAWENGEISPVDERLLRACGTAVDLIYVPSQSEFLRIADSLGKKTVNGASMLFYQAYMADCIYLGREPSDGEAKRLWKKYREA
ncbi:MAG: shikimate dehydrogenase family protein [Candidatus Gallimonas sp.]